MNHLLSRQVALALLILAGAPAIAADYYVVAPVLGKKVANDAIAVSLGSLSPPVGHVGLGYAGFDLRPALRVEGDPTYTGYGVKWQIVAGALPAGLVLNGDGTISGTPAVEGAFDVTIRAAYKTKTGDQQYRVLTYRIQVGLASGTPPQAMAGEAYSYDLVPLLTVSGDSTFKPSAVTWSVVANTLPAGLYLTADGRIAGTPTAGGTGTLTARASYRGTNGERTYQVVSLNVSVALASATLPVGVTGNSYPGFDFTSVLTVSGDATYSPGAATWSLVSGTLPAGLVLTASGALTGTPTAAASSAFTLAATYRKKSDQRTYTLQVDAAQVTGALLPTTSPDFGTVIVGGAANRSFTFANNGNTTAAGVQAAVTGAGVTITSNTCGTASAPAPLAKGDSCKLTARYSPTAGGAMSGNVTVSWSGPAPGKSTLAITGEAKYDYSSMMSSYTANAIAIGRNAAWADGVQWYWRSADAQVSAEAGTFEFRRAITVAGNAPVSAQLYGGSDDASVVLAVNGTHVANLSMGFTGHQYSQPFTLQPGINVVSVKVTNAGNAANPAGLALQVRSMDGATLADEHGWRYQP